MLDSDDPVRNFAEFKPVRTLLLIAVLALPAFAIDLPKKPTTCARHGTTIDFVESPKEAAAQAKKEEKLVLVLHISGHFEDESLT